MILQDWEDMEGLEIKPFESLSHQQRCRWSPIDRRIREQGKAPSLSAYIIDEYHFKKRILRDLAKELGKSYQGLLNFMNSLGIPPRNHSEALLGQPSPRKGRTYEDIYGEGAIDVKQKLIEARERGSPVK